MKSISDEMPLLDRAQVWRLRCSGAIYKDGLWGQQWNNNPSKKNTKIVSCRIWTYWIRCMFKESPTTFGEISMLRIGPASHSHNIEKRSRFCERFTSKIHEIGVFIAWTFGYFRIFSFFYSANPNQASGSAACLSLLPAASRPVSRYLPSLTHSLYSYISLCFSITVLGE